MHFTNIIDLELTIKPAIVDDLGWIITDFNKKLVKKKNKCKAKRKKWFLKFYTLIRSPLFFCPKFFTIWLFCYIPALIFCPRLSAVLLFCCVPAVVFCLKSSNILLSYYMPALAISAILSSICQIFIFCYRISAFLLPLLLLYLFFLLEFSLFRIFKQFLSNKS